MIPPLLHTTQKQLRATCVCLCVVALLMVISASVAHAAVADASWQKGASMWPSSPDDYGSNNFQQSLRDLKSIGATYVNLTIPYAQSNTGSTDIAPTYNTPTDAALVSGIQYAHSLGMKVMLSTYLNLYSGEWRANINPGDRNTWYANYGNFLNRYAQIAAQQGVEQYSLGAELISMTSAYVNPDNTQRWDTLIANVRSRYSGSLTYDANRDIPGGGFSSEASNIAFWDKLDSIGISAYYEFPGDGSVSSLTGAWQWVNDYEMTPLANKWHKPILFTEVGYRSVTNAHATPWDSGMGGAYDPQEQVNDYTALFQYWNSHASVNGVFVWWWSPNPQYGGSGNTDYTPQNKPALDVFKQWWGGSSVPPPIITSGNVSNWWPVDGAHVSGVQPFKALLDNTPLSQYTMYWQVDGDRLNQMYDSQQDWPHKEAIVDVSSWHWQSGGTYTIAFIAKNLQGTIIAQKVLQIHVP